MNNSTMVEAIYQLKITALSTTIDADDELGVWIPRTGTPVRCVAIPLGPVTSSDQEDQ